MVHTPGILHPQYGAFRLEVAQRGPMEFLVRRKRRGFYGLYAKAIELT